MSRRRVGSLVASLVVFAAAMLFSISGAAAQNLLKVKISSLDAALGDVETIARKAGQDLGKEKILAMALGSVGLADSSWIDSSKPIVVILPASGMMMGGQGIVGALPVKDVNAAFSALEGFFQNHEVEEEVHRFSNDAFAITVRTEDNYLILGAVPNLVKGFQLGDALALGDFPRGNIAAELALEPVLPLVQMGMMQGRMVLDQQMKDKDDAGAMSGLVDLYFGLIQDVLNNLSLLQVSVELRGDDLVSHARFVPKADSTMDEWVRGQDVGIPSALGAVLRNDPVFVGAGAIKYTPKMKEAMKYYADQYVKAVDKMLAGLSEEDAASVEWLGPMLNKALALVDKALACGGGEFAAGGWVKEGSGLSYASLQKVEDREACGTLLAAFSEIFNSGATELGGESSEARIKMSSSSYTYKGSNAEEYSIDLGGIMKAMSGGSDDAEAALTAGFLNDGIFQQITGLYGEWMVTAGGADAGATYNGVIDRVDTPGKQVKAADVFAPLGSGNGAFFTLSLSRFLDILPADADDEELQMLRDLDMRLVYGIEFDGKSVDVQSAFPLSVIEKVVALQKAEHAHDQDEH